MYVHVYIYNMQCQGVVSIYIHIYLDIYIFICVYICIYMHICKYL